MLSSHTYWNLDGFQNPHTPLALDHTLHLPYAGFRPEVDNILIPTGDILSNNKYSVNDWWTAPKPLGANLSAAELLGNCGWNCTGYDVSCFSSLSSPPCTLRIPLVEKTLSGLFPPSSP